MSQQVKSDYLHALETYNAAEAKIQEYLRKNKDYQAAMSTSRRVKHDSPKAFHILQVVCFIEGEINEQYKMQTIRAHLKQCEDKLLDATKRHAQNLHITHRGDPLLLFKNPDQYKRGIGLVNQRTTMLALALQYLDM